MQKALKLLTANKGGGTTKGGAGGGDAYTVMLVGQRKEQTGIRDCRQTGPIITFLPLLPPPLSEVRSTFEHYV